MKRFFVLGVVLLTVISCGDESDWVQYGVGTGETGYEIINGEVCGEEIAPSAVAVIADMKVSFGGWGAQEIRSVSCTGTLIARDTVLTAAHCVDRDLLKMSMGGVGDIEEVNYYISFTSDLTAFSSNPRAVMPVDAVKASEWIGHPEFSMTRMSQVSGVGEFYDVGLIFLERPIDWVEPAVLISKSEAGNIQVGSPVSIAGWGMQTAEGGSWGQPPPAGTVGVKVCAASSINELGAAEIQIGSDVNSSRKCHGDSGGPSYLTIETETARKERVIGVTSHAYDQTDCQKGGVDSRVDVWLDWINDEMERRCDAGTRVWCEVAGAVPATYYDPLPPEEEPAQEEEGCACRQSNSGASWILLGGFGFILGRRRRSAARA